MRARLAGYILTRVMNTCSGMASSSAVHQEALARFATSVRPCMHARSRVTVCCNRRSASGPASVSSGLGAALGWPVVPLHFQRKVHAWSRSYNAEEAVAAPAAPASSATLPFSEVNPFFVNPGLSANAVDPEPIVNGSGVAAAINGSSIDSLIGNGKSQNGASVLKEKVSTASPSSNGTSATGSGAEAAPAPAASASNSNSSSSADATAFEVAEIVAGTSTSSQNSEKAAEAPTAAEASAPPEAAAASSIGSSSKGSGAAVTSRDAAGPPSTSSSSEGSGDTPASGNGAGPAIRLLLQSGAAMLPHPDKAHRGGEDSFFIADHQAAVGVADGVGGWAEIGVDAGAYARLLMVHAKEAADAANEDVAAGTLSSQAILESAFYRTNVQGSSTACVLVVNGTTLSASNLGDSGFVLVRDGVATFQCPQQQHNFNFPFQLGSADSMSDQPQAAMRFDLQLQPGDIIVTGSDGLWDNIFAEEAATIASKCRDKGETATTAAQVLCRYARMRASDAKYHSPFSYAAIQAGYVYLGGKMDDITVVVSYVALPPAKL